MNKILARLILGFALGIASSYAFAGSLIFEDKSNFENFSVYSVTPSGQASPLPKSDGVFAYSYDLAGSQVGDQKKFSLRFWVPTEEGSDNFEVRNTVEMQVSIEIVITEALMDGFTVPVYYFRCIGACGFAEIDPVPNGILDRQFERFFKAALMAEHYFLRLKSWDSGLSRRSVQLWRDASYYLGEHTLDWWRMTPDILEASKRAFGEDSARHRATVKYFSDVNTD